MGWNLGVELMQVLLRGIGFLLTVISRGLVVGKAECWTWGTSRIERSALPNTVLRLLGPGKSRRDILVTLGSQD